MSRIKRCDNAVSTCFITTFMLHPLAASAAPITFNTALPVGQEEWVLRQQFIYGQGDGGNKSAEALRSVSVLGYGITPDFTLFGVVPFMHRDMDVGGGANRDATGVSDTQLIGRLTAFKDDFTGGTFRISPFFGVELPTGKNNKQDSTGKLPPSLQPGSGSVDALGGVVASYASFNLNMDAQLYWQGNNEADSIERGDIFKADVSIQPRLLPQEIAAQTRGFLYGALELNLEHQNKTQTLGVADTNSGGTKFFVTPGLHYTTKRWMAEMAVQIPVTQSVGGTNIENDYRIFTGVRVNF